MSLAVRVNNGVVTKDSVGEGEAAQYEALKRSVLAKEEQRKQEERDRQHDLGLPAETSEVSKKGSIRKRLLAFMCLGVNDSR